MQMKKEESIPLHVGLVPGPFLSETEIYFNDVSKDEQIKRIVLVSKKHIEQKFPHLWNIMKVQALAKEYIHYQVEINKKKEIVAEFPSKGDSKILEITCVLQYAQSNQLYEFLNASCTQKEDEEFQLMADCQDHCEFRKQALEQFTKLRRRIFMEGTLNQTRQEEMQNALETTQKALEITQKALETIQKELENTRNEMQKKFGEMMESKKLRKEKMIQIQKIFQEYSEL